MTIAVGAAAVAALLVFALRHVLGADVAPLVLLVAVALAARYGGRLAGLVATLLALGGTVGFLATDGDGGFGLHDFVQLGLMAVVATLLSLLGNALHESHLSLQQSRVLTESLRRSGERAELGLRRVRAVVDSLGIGVVVADTSGALLDWNPAALRLFGLGTADEVRGPLSSIANRFVLSQPDGPPLPIEEWPVSRAIRGERVVDCELDVKADGASEPLRLRFDAATVVEPTSRTELVVLSMRDLTAERRAQAELRRTGDLLRAVVEGTSDAVFVKDAAGRYVLMNEAGARAVGRPVSEVIGVDDVHLFGPEGAALLRDRDRAVIAAGVPLVTEETLPQSAGGRTWLTTKAPLRDASGRVVGLIGISRDITDRKRAEIAMQQGAKFVRSVLDSIVAHIAVLDSRGRILAVNAAWEAFSVANSPGRARAEATGPGADYLAACDAAAAAGDREAAAAAVAIRDVIEGRAQTRSLEYGCHAPGRQRWFLMHVWPMLGLQGGAVVSHFDVTDRKLAEAERASTQEHLRLFLEHTPAPVAMFDRDMRYLAHSRRWVSDYGLGDAELTGRSHYEVFPEIGEEWRELHRRSLAGAVERREADPFHRRDGTVQWLRWEMRPWRDVSGAIGGIVIFSEDITARRQAESQVRDSEERYRRLIEMLPEAVFLQADNRLTFANPAFLRLVGAGAVADVLGRSPYEFFHPDFHAAIRSRIAAMRDAGRPAPALEERLVRLDGREVPVEVVATPIVDHGVPSILVAVYDLSDRHRTMGLLQSVLGSVGDAILVIDERGVVRSANTATQRLFGHEPRSLVGRNVSVLMPEPFASRHDGFLADYLRTGIARVIGIGREVEAVRADGSRFPAELTVTEFTMDGARHFTGVLRDITARRQLETQFQQVQKMEAVGRLAGGIAHDFNNLLTVINGHSDLLLAMTASDDPAREDLTAIRESGERAARLTRQLLTFSRQGVVAPRVLDLGDLVGSSVKLLRRMIGEDVRVEVAIAAGLPAVRVDPGQLEQLLMNLVVNARDAMPTGGRLRIGLAEHDVAESVTGGPVAGRYVRLSVGDNGCGMTEEVRRRIFEPFFTTKPAGRGTGLGLSVVHGIVAQSGGFIAVQSEPGVGTTFEVLLPATTVEVDDAEFATPAPLAAGGATVLLVEDEDAVRQVARTVLESHGYTVLEAGSGRAALALATAHGGPIDLLLTDVVMPEMGGRELAEALRAVRPGLRVLYTSGYTDDAMVHHGVVAADASFLAKPFTPLVLLHKVAEVLAAPA